MKSMTGYGISRYVDEECEFDIELKSVNSRFLDFKIFLPKELNFLEIVIRESVKKAIHRGKIEIRINFYLKKMKEIKIDLEKLKSFKKAFDFAKIELNLNDKFPLADFFLEDEKLQQSDILFEQSTIEKIVLKSLQSVIKEHQKMALNEGRAMKKFLQDSFKVITKALRKIESEFPKYKKKIYQKMVKNITHILETKLKDDDYKRIMLEAALYIDKADVSEEIIRIKDHIEKFLNILKEKKNEIGKTLNFILQEMHREINTIGSKYNSKIIFSEILIIKQEIEKCRELVQNVE